MVTTKTTVKHAAMDLPGVVPAWRWHQDRLRPACHALLRDAVNRAVYGPTAPRFAERLWIDPRRVQHFAHRGNGSKTSALVESGEWGSLQAISEDLVLQTSIARWVDHLPWEETGEVERMEAAIARHGPRNGCRDREDILARCQHLDRIFAIVESERKIRTQRENNPRAFRELGGIGMHIGPAGAPIRAANGRHRFAMAWILGLESVPVRIGRVHCSALPILPELRRAR